MRISAPIVRLNRRRPVADLVIAECDVHQHRVGWCVGQRVRRHVLRVPVSLAAVPEHLHQRQQDLAVGLGRVGVVDEPGKGGNAQELLRFSVAGSGVPAPLRCRQREE